MSCRCLKPAVTPILLMLTGVVPGLWSGCRDGQYEIPTPAGTDSGLERAEATSMGITIESAAFASGGGIPQKYTGDGADVSPPLAWTGVPDGTQELALICDDPDAPTPDPWVHWVIYRLPADITELPEGVPRATRIDQPVPALQGRNSWSSGTTTGYRGPAPPAGHGTHHYHFRLYALDARLDLQPGIDKTALLQAMQGHILAEGELIGTYSR